MQQRLTAILPCNDLDAAEAFFARFGFQPGQGSLDDNRMLSDGLGGFIHLNPAVEGWLQAGRNPFGLYLYREDVDGAARVFVAKRYDSRALRPGECMSSPLTAPKKLSGASAGRRACAARLEPERQRHRETKLSASPGLTRRRR